MTKAKHSKGRRGKMRHFKVSRQTTKPPNGGLVGATCKDAFSHWTSRFARLSSRVSLRASQNEM